MLKGKTAIVTGGSRGIGFVIAHELVNAGFKVVICSRSKNQLNNEVKKLSNGDKNVFGTVADVSNFAECEKLINFAKSKMGRIDVLVNNAGIFGPVGLLETNDPKAWEDVLATNVLAAVFCSKLVIPIMKKQRGGKIINLAGAGVGGSKSIPRFSSYYTSKTAVVNFTECLAAELQPFNIRVNSIAPGAVASELTLGLLKMDKSQVGDDMYQTSKKLLEQGGTPPELAGKLVAFLASKEANHITGRLLSAKWDKIEDLKKAKRLPDNLYRLRRIDNEFFCEK